MLKFDQVLHAHLSSLKEAITGWSETVSKLEKAKEKADTGLQGKADKADWKGENAGVTQAFVRKTAKEFGDALTEARSIRNILRDAETEFQAAKSELEKLVAEAPGKGIRIDQDGVVSYLIHPDRRAKDYDGPKPEQADFEAMRSAIKAAITRADDADDVASRALRTLVGGDKNNFSGTNYDSLKAASKVQDAEDAHAAYELYKKGDEATPAEIDKLNALFKANQKDPYFAEKFALEVGPKGSMEYWADMGDPSDGSRLGVDHRDKLKELQTNWSMTLATATHSTSPEMEQWKADVIKAGTEPIQTRGTSPYGFQVMSNLLRVGDYDDKFLKDYGNGLVVAERKMTHDGALPPGRAWQQMGGQPSHLNWLGGDLGKDPMIGFMEGLGHNPKASTEFFNSDIDLTPENSKDNKKLDPFDYFSKDREWPEELNDKGNLTKEPGYNALGHALESATTGHPYDAEAEGLKDVRTKENAEVMQKVVERYGSDPKFMHQQPGIDDSLGKMGAAYIDELNRSLETDSDTTMEEKTNSPFGYNDAKGKSRFGEEFDTGLLWNRGDAVNFMGIVSQSETGHATLSAAETLYTTSVLDQVGPKPGTPFDERDLTDARTTLRIGSEAQGIMDESRMAQIDKDYEKDSEEHKKAVGKTTEWVKFGVGAVAAGGVVALTGGAGGVLVPLAAETVGGAVTTFIGMEADDIAEKYEKDEMLKKKSDDLKSEALSMGKENSLRPGIAYANAPGWNEKDRNYLDEILVDYVRDARLHARDNDLPDPYEKK
ncbi:MULTISPECIES: DUF6571 family protein [Streptomyces]|uniref:Uncharacterized protein n=1 Tax=Streptomyces venezuelae (strain ATCC 10712 / CBS 650.69 / DSM 40230 / JCM 4526 / NBRC 13096 / PD 04745) TaxID=953739 RepID=F2R4W7_STRVP|nr:DUF6571 family protein [Streptomyces venezuelae]APE21889.1 hypothetical protein vnz_13250 [Streptomyces venezuelae]QER99283.1 hypothetical protein DEJ43_13420 [Streptomyces venezuelae ATCC 10712]CCA55988.1 hypothetical protein SVEN_2702 [Streptomyces venezuelae ATCC 10712]